VLVGERLGRLLRDERLGDAEERENA